MKKILFIISSVFITNCCIANKIDSLTTKKQVNDFLIENIDTFFHKYYAFGRNLGYGTDSFYKVDINSDGLTDLILDAHGYRSLIIIDLGGNKYDDIPNYGYTYFKTIKVGKINALVYYDSIWVSGTEKIGRIDTIICKYGKLFRYHPNKPKYKIQKLFYTAGGCYGTCPVFSIEIHQDGAAFLDAEAYNESKDSIIKGKFAGQISDSMLRVIHDVINELDSEDLYYKEPWESVDGAVAGLEIWYDSGKHITMGIPDGGGTQGQNSVQRMFEELRFIDVWQPWDLTSLNDSTYLSFSQLFSSANSRNTDSYSKETYTDTTRAQDKQDKSQVFLLLHNLGLDMYDSANIHGNHSYIIECSAFIQINPDHSFVFGQTEFNGAPSIMSGGIWKKESDSTIELNWTLQQTRAAVKDSILWKQYFPKSLTAEPIAIEGWRLKYNTKNSKVLVGIGAKKDEQ